MAKAAAAPLGVDVGTTRGSVSGSSWRWTHCAARRVGRQVEGAGREAAGQDAEPPGNGNRLDPPACLKAVIQKA